MASSMRVGQGRAAARGRVCIVTGGSRGCGKGIAAALAKEGAVVYVTGRGKSRTSEALVGSGALATSAAEATAAGAAAGGRCVAYVCDHSDDAAVDKLIADVFEREGRIDCLINNAYAGTDLDNAANGFKPFYERPVSSYDGVFQIGLRASYVAMLSVCRRWIDRKERGGLVVNISSGASVSRPGRGALVDSLYSTCKAALNRLTADTSRELRKHGVSVVALIPGVAGSEQLLANLKPGGPLHGRKDFGIDGVEMESVEFMGRGVAALLADDDVLRRLSGRLVSSAELAQLYGFTDVDGTVPWGFLHTLRDRMGSVPHQFALKKDDFRPLHNPRL